MPFFHDHGGIGGQFRGPAQATFGRLEIVVLHGHGPAQKKGRDHVGDVLEQEVQLFFGDQQVVFFKGTARWTSRWSGFLGSISISLSI